VTNPASLRCFYWWWWWWWWWCEDDCSMYTCSVVQQCLAVLGLRFIWGCS